MKSTSKPNALAVLLKASLALGVAVGGAIGALRMIGRRKALSERKFIGEIDQIANDARERLLQAAHEATQTHDGRRENASETALRIEELTRETSNKIREITEDYKNRFMKIEQETQPQSA
ncbi:MAG: hypothetical protein GF398_03030 [Chitinivibrionales bacterium]|nr:hypothetical protein [Chitinivibrionales bacterium]